MLAMRKIGKGRGTHQELIYAQLVMNVIAFGPDFLYFFFNNTHVEHTTITICTGRAFLKRFSCLCVCVAGFCSLIFLTVVVIQ